MIRSLTLTAISAAVTILASASDQFGYDAPLYPIKPKLISQSVQLNEIPTKVIKITRTVAVKVPVAYPVKVPYHIPIPVPVNHPVAVPVPQIVKVPHHVPVRVDRPFGVELPQQVPVYVGKPVPVPHPVPVPKPILISKPVYVPVPHGIPYPVHDYHGDHTQHHDIHASLYAAAQNYGLKEGVEGEGEQAEARSETQQAADTQSYYSDFRPSQPDYNNPE